MTPDLKQAIDSANEVLLEGLKAGQEIGKTEAEMRARPLVEALETWAEVFDMWGTDEIKHSEAREKARAALAAYRGER